MTEFEYEKSARGDRFPVENKYAWADDKLSTTTYTVSGAGTAAEVITNPSMITWGMLNTLPGATGRWNGRYALVFSRPPPSYLPAS